MKQKPKLLSLLTSSAAMAALLQLSACGASTSSAGTSSGDDSSASGVAASAVGGALSTSSSTGTMAMSSLPGTAFLSKIEQVVLPEPLAVASASSFSCPTIKTSSSCTQNTSAEVTLDYDICSFSSSEAVWNGFLFMGVSGTATSLTCGSALPSFSTGTSYLNRQFVNGSSVAAAATRTSALGTVVTISHAASSGVQLGNFNGDTLSSFNSGAYLFNSGWGSQVKFVSGARTSVSVFENLSASSALGRSLYDHTVAGTLAVTDSGASGTRTVNGSMTVYHNLLKVVGTAVFSNVEHNDSCCTAVSGTITTTFAAGSNTSEAPTVLGALLVGKSESLAFTSTCGQATYTDTTGAVSTVTLGCF